MFDSIRVGSRRWFLQTGLAGVGGLTLPALLQANEAAKASDRKAVILFWLSGGPSHIDMWDPKPETPREIRGPYSSIETKLPGVRLSEHLPKQASTRALNKFSERALMAGHADFQSVQHSTGATRWSQSA